MEFIVGVLIVGGIWAYSTMRKNYNHQIADILSSEATSWYEEQGINPESVKYSIYRDPALVQNVGASIIVGAGDRSDGRPVGFAVEIVSGKGVIEGDAYLPVAICSIHKGKAVVYAKTYGLSLLDALGTMALEFRAKYPNAD